MPYDKHQATAAIDFSDMSGGINLSRPPSLIAVNECEDLLNVEFNFNRVNVRGGLSAPFSIYPSDIWAVFYVDYTDTFITVTKNKTVYEDDWVNQPRYAGVLNGNSRPRFCRYDNKYFIASGGKLQYLTPQTPGAGGDSGTLVLLPDSKAYEDGNVIVLSPSIVIEDEGNSITLAATDVALELITINNSPECDGVFERMGRLVVFKTGSDVLHYSAVGNPYEDGWEEITDDDSSYKWIEIGYKADGDILDVAPLANDLLVFKSGGNVYNLSGEYPNWVIQEAAKHTDVLNRNCVENIRGRIVYISNRGLYTVDPVERYGNFNFAELGFKFNAGLAKDLKQPCIYNLYRKSQMLVCPDTARYPNDLWNFYWENNAVIRVSFPKELGNVEDIVDTQKGAVIAIGNKIYQWDKGHKTDNGLPIHSRIATRVALGSDKALVKYVDTLMRSDNQDECVKITINDTERDNHTAILGNTPTDKRKRKLINHSSRAVQVVVEGDVPYELNHLSVGMTGL